jgi:hypothetical protein
MAAHQNDGRGPEHGQTGAIGSQWIEGKKTEIQCGKTHLTSVGKTHLKTRFSRWEKPTTGTGENPTTIYIYMRCRNIYRGLRGAGGGPEHRVGATVKGDQALMRWSSDEVRETTNCLGARNVVLRWYTM